MRRNNLLLGTVPPKDIRSENAIFCFETVPVEVISGREGRATRGELCIFRVTLNKEVGRRRNRARGYFTLLILRLIGGHCERLGEAMRVPVKRVLTLRVAEFISVSTPIWPREPGRDLGGWTQINTVTDRLDHNAHSSLCLGSR